MTDIGDRLEAYWKTQSIEPPVGVSEDRLRQFENRFSMNLLLDIRNYFLRINGMGSRNEVDDDFFSFGPSEDVVPASEISEEEFIEDRSSNFVFADHSIELFSFAIHLGSSESFFHPVIAIHSDPGEYRTSMVARSFSEFVERYLFDENSRIDLSAGFPLDD